MKEKILWIGRDTRRNIKWEAKANTYKELWDELLSMNIVHDEQYDRYLSKVTGIDPNDLETDEEYYAWYESYDLDEDEYKELIRSCDGNAYYQEFYEWNEEAEEYE